MWGESIIHGFVSQGRRQPLQTDVVAGRSGCRLFLFVGVGPLVVW
jgi:hypothetical protein